MTLQHTSNDNSQQQEPALEARKADGTDKTIPTLPHGCGSWVVTSPHGRVVELFERGNAEKAAAAGWKIETAIGYLARLNAEIREGNG